LVEALHDLPDLQAKAQPQQDSAANYAEKLSKEEAQLDFHKTAAALEREIRAFNPWPVSYLQLATQQLKIWQARVETGSAQPGQVVRVDKKGIAVGTADGLLVIEQLQPPGKKAMTVVDFLNGRADWFQPGQQLQHQTEQAL
jgi:methionyl-tRNA formyltransferase